ncbi:MAG: hypothetical protein QOJ93_2969 [Actinomycetota bacterium]|nr:hypothetical protein [Actinomycetota bacterium]
MFADLLAQPGVVETVELRSKFGFMAFHGGLEGGTAEIAGQGAEQAGASLYAVVQPPNMTWHVPSIEVTPDVSEGLAAFVGHVDVAVAIHGYGRRERPYDILLGGTNRELAAHIAAHLCAGIQGFEIVDDLEQIPANLRGLHRRNPVNLPRCGGVQIELPPRARDRRLGAYRGEPCIPVDGLIDALSRAAATYPSTSKVPPERQ